jgi:uncharacterized phage protein (TIGR02216 family)
MPDKIWRRWLRLAAGMNIAPAQFWRLSVVEWRALIGHGAGEAPLLRAELSALAARFPDKDERH